jgi:TetR/AcrR family transcriptional regulator, mexJK operon transcriptional repressor
MRETTATATAGPERRHRAPRLASGGAIREAATRLFLEKGYQGTSMDEIAAAAQVSKQTIYTHFAGKEELFADLVLGNAERVDEFVGMISRTLAEAEGSLEDGLKRVARTYLRIVVTPDVLRLRRLVLGEASRFPDLARIYYERVPGRVLTELEQVFGRIAAEGRLRIDDPSLAADHFAWLVLGLPLDRGMFYPDEDATHDVDLDRVADSAVRVFLAAYGPD